MPIKSDTTDIDDLRVTTTQYAVVRQSQLLGLWLGVVGPFAGALMRGISADEAKAEEVLDELLEMDIGPAIAQLFTRLTRDKIAELINETLAGTSVICEVGEGDKAEKKNVSLSTQRGIEQVFAGRLMDMYRAMAHALKTNFSDFSGAARSLARGLDARKKKD